MPKYEIDVVETVTHIHRMIVECADKNTAEDAANELWERANDGKFDHRDDVAMAAREIVTLLDFDEDYSVDSEDITIYEGEVQEVDDNYRVIRE